MSRFVVCAWSHDGNADQLEAGVPLLYNGRRMSRLGLRNEIIVLFLKGWRLLPDWYRMQLAEFGYEVIDAEQKSLEVEARIPSLRVVFKNWGGIQHYCILRILLLKHFFSGDSIVTFDGDMVVNSGFDEIRRAVDGRFYLLDNSTCFISIPARHDFLDIFEKYAFLWNDDPIALNEELFGSANPGDVYDPGVINGTDQGLVLLLREKGILQMEVDPKILTRHGMVGFANWLTLGDALGEPVSYERRSGVDYINGRKILISHLSHDACAYFGSYLYMTRLFGEGWSEKFGRLPLPYKHYGVQDPNNGFFDYLLSVRNATGAFPDLSRYGLNPFSRAAVIDAFYESGDFSSVLNDRVWHASGVFVDRTN